ncbi:MAG: FecR domain-containing protein [Tannerellaceae bacterium]|jgi:ferric-dicitrate binding protein FerR (iron transport regulator)|nr:FecR domain-containing protein [Tannerellaceae bacterium]
MNLQDPEHILVKYFQAQQLTKDEINILRSYVLETKDTSLINDLQELWLSYDGAGERNRESFDEVLHSIQDVILSEKRKPALFFIRRIAAAVLLPVFLLSTVYLYLEKESIKTSISREYRLEAEKGERASIILPDGTKVYLNSESSLSYPASYVVDNRSVYLSGEAYFEVTHDPAHPFVVTTDKARVQVYGTAFNICAYPADTIFEATLVEGKVEVTLCDDSEQSVFLKPNQKASYNTGSGRLQVHSTDLRIETAWKRGDLIFRSQPLEAIFNKLESFYGATIYAKGTYPENLFTGSFHEDEIGEVLNNLQQHYSFSFRKSGNEIHILFGR